MQKQPNPQVLLRLVRIRAGLLLDEVGIGSLIMELKLVEDTTCSTAWTDGIHLGYNPEFVTSLTDQELRALFVHEVMHCASGHPWRRGGRNIKLWQEACDHSINPILVDSGYKLPEGGLYDPRFAGKSAEWIYNELRQQQQDSKSKQNQQQKGPQQPGQPGQNGQDGQSEEGADEDSSDDSSEHVGQPSDKKGDKASKGGKSQSEQEGDKQPGQGGEQSDEQGDNENDAQGDGQGDSDSSEDGQPQGTISDRDGLPDSGKLGELRDAPANVSKEGLETSWNIAKRNALKAAKMAGKGKGSMFIDLMNNTLESRTDWRQELWTFFKSHTAKNDYFFARPNTRYLAQGLYLPSLRSEDAGPLVVALDVSGSMMTLETLSQMKAELRAIINEIKPEVAYVLYCDERIVKVEKYERGEEFEIIQVVGGGGTSFIPIFDFIEKENIDPDALIYLTDGLGAFPSQEPSYPVLWTVLEQDKDRAFPFGNKVVLWAD